MPPPTVGRVRLLLALLCFVVCACAACSSGSSSHNLTSTQRSELLQVCLASQFPEVRAGCPSKVVDLANFVAKLQCTYADATAMMSEVARKQGGGLTCPSLNNGNVNPPTSSTNN